MTGQVAAKIPRVLMVVPHVGVGGLERMVLSLCRTLKQHGTYDPVLFAFDHDPQSTYQNLLPELQAAQIPVHTMHKGPGFSFGVVREILRICRQEHISIIHSHNLGSLMYASLAASVRRHQLRLVHTQHSFMHLRERWRYGWYERVFNRLADCISAVSEDTKLEYVRLGFRPDQVTLIPNGVQLSEAPVLTVEERQAHRRNLIERLTPENPGLANQLQQHLSDFWILYLARVYKGKGQDQALRIWPFLERKLRSTALLLLVGPAAFQSDIEELENIRRDLPNSDRVIYAGGTREPPLWLKASDLFISCSEFEGLPLGPIEALGSGVPAVLSAIPGHGSVATESWQFTPGDLAGAARQIEECSEEMNAGYTRMKQTLWDRTRWLVTRYSIESMTVQYEKLYRLAWGQL